mmetsp:Transcript_5911/g.20848  ORF Transcript_5911/g.20848 Transcript_5911/m.20848 type:complete len:264 (+) Transcript_5911:1084-1875(+)
MRGLSQETAHVVLQYVRVKINRHRRPPSLPQTIGIVEDALYPSIPNLSDDHHLPTRTHETRDFAFEVRDDGRTRKRERDLDRLLRVVEMVRHKREHEVGHLRQLQRDAVVGVKGDGDVATGALELGAVLPRKQILDHRVVSQLVPLPHQLRYLPVVGAIAGRHLDQRLRSDSIQILMQRVQQEAQQLLRVVLEEPRKLRGAPSDDLLHVPGTHCHGARSRPHLLDETRVRLRDGPAVAKGVGWVEIILPGGSKEVVGESCCVG